MKIEAIGTIESPFKRLEDMPIQPSGAHGKRGRIRLNSDLEAGLADLHGFSHIMVLYFFHRVKEVQLTVQPFLDQQTHGIFATRAPTRPNSIGLSILKLNGIEGCVLDVENIDILDGTPLLDIKPYVPQFDQPDGVVRVGWLEKRAQDSRSARSDQRFT